MPSSCAVVNCRDRYAHSENVSFHKFPLKRQELLQKWLDFAKRGDAWKPSRWSSICSRHFRDKDFNRVNERKTLKKNAVPSLYFTEQNEADVGTELSDDSFANRKNSVGLDKPNKKLKGNNKAAELQENVEKESDHETTESQSQPSASKINCRLCGHVAANVVTFSTNFEIYGMIQKCFPTLNIQKDDNLPKEICRHCLKRLENFSRFIDKVVETQSELQRKFRIEKTNNNRVAERQLKVKQEPVVRIKQEVSEGFETFLSDDLDIAMDDGCEHDQHESAVDQKYDFCDFPILNAQDIINDCDIMEIINLDDPFINIPDDDANTNCDMQQQQMPPKGTLQSAHDLLQLHLLIEEHNYANIAEKELQLKSEGNDMSEELAPAEHWDDEELQLKSEGIDISENLAHTKRAGDEPSFGNSVEMPRTPLTSETVDTTIAVAVQSLLANEEKNVETSRSTKPIVTSVSNLRETPSNLKSKTGTNTPAIDLPTKEENNLESNRSIKPIVTSVSNLVDTHLSLPTDAQSSSTTENSLVTAVKTMPAPSTSANASKVKTHTKPNIVVLNESIVKSSDAFQLYTCNCCQLKFFSTETLNQHYATQHQPLPMVSVPGEYAWKPTGEIEDTFERPCKIEKGNELNLYETDMSMSLQSSNTIQGNSYTHNTTFLPYVQPLRQELQVTSEATVAVTNKKNEVKILEMQQTFLRHHEHFPSLESDAVNYKKTTELRELIPSVVELDNVLMSTPSIGALSKTTGFSDIRAEKKAEQKSKRTLTRFAYAVATSNPSMDDPKQIAMNFLQLQRRVRKLKRECKSLKAFIQEQRAGKPQHRNSINSQRSIYRFLCRVCCEHFPNIHKLLRHKHLKRHWSTPSRPQFAATCCGCQRFFRSKKSLCNHMRYVCQAVPLRWLRTQMQTFRCRHCQRSTFNHWRLYRRHEVKCKRTQEVRRQRERQLQICQRLFTPIQQNYDSVDTIKRTNNGLGSSNGTQCQLANTGTRNYVCVICKKTFSSRNSLSQHGITHTDQRKHKCKLCTRAFKRRNGLTQHIKGFHLQLKPFRCLVCQHCYALKSDMLRCKHSGRRNYEVPPQNALS